MTRAPHRKGRERSSMRRRAHSLGGERGTGGAEALCDVLVLRTCRTSHGRKGEGRCRLPGILGRGREAPGARVRNAMLSESNRVVITSREGRGTKFRQAPEIPALQGGGLVCVLKRRMGVRGFLRTAHRG